MFFDVEIGPDRRHILVSEVFADRAFTSPRIILPADAGEHEQPRIVVGEGSEEHEIGRLIDGISLGRDAGRAGRPGSRRY
ncbi:hypothetical protein M2175_003912 [Bradyrhizobium elkanii]|uniref:hypothetical protein n=1 Tax=Bradyrhizobium TaxID=374 RepID=UPI002167E50A|nr:MULTISPECIES: hypothetical protein [Bradyrhizobium]MCS3928881.1 hypothetical protein [Bradyrhizobium elkanii]MCS3969436.1 hypothetical protein [Bradyrhizobium japonicum]